MIVVVIVGIAAESHDSAASRALDVIFQTFVEGDWIFGVELIADKNISSLVPYIVIIKTEGIVVVDIIFCIVGVLRIKDLSGLFPSIQDISHIVFISLSILMFEKGYIPRLISGFCV
jgi:hypothetical protein